MRNKSMMLQGIAERLKTARHERGLTMIELEAKAKASTGYVFAIEHCRIKNPGIFSLIRLADALEISPEWLMFGREKQ